LNFDLGIVISLGLTYENFKLIYDQFKIDWYEINIFSDLSPYGHLIKKSFQLSNWMTYLNLVKNTVKIENILIFPHSINLSLYNKQDKNFFKKKFNIKNENKILLRVGQPLDGKWSKKIIKAFVQINKISKNFNLVLVGAPKKIKDEIDLMGHDIKKKIFLINFVQDKKLLNDIYASADIFWHIADQGESFGYVILESILNGTPVISMQTPWSDNTQSEILSASQSGYACHSLKDFVKKTLDLISDTKKYENMVENGKKYIDINFSTESISKKINEQIFLSKKTIISKKLLKKKMIETLYYGKSDTKTLILLTFYKIFLLLNLRLFFFFTRLVRKLY
jgi:glycosyltransferase involved in cell wall biosynthesis